MKINYYPPSDDDNGFIDEYDDYIKEPIINHTK